MAVGRNILGPVVDINISGLAFHYSEKAISEEDLDNLGIFLGVEDFLIDNIQTKVISDKLVTKGSAFITEPTRRRTVKFLNMTKEQKKLVNYFISNNTVEKL